MADFVLGCLFGGMLESMGILGPGGKEGVSKVTCLEKGIFVA